MRYKKSYIKALENEFSRLAILSMQTESKLEYLAITEEMNKIIRKLEMR